MWVLNIDDRPELEDQSNWRMILAICVVFSFVSTLIVGMRLWIRFAARGLAWDDLMAFLAMIFAVVYAALCIAQTRYGLGLVPKDRPPASLDTYLKVNFAGRPIYQLGISFFKIALLISYLRLFKGTNQSIYVRTVWTTIVLVFLGHVAATFCLIFACKPVAKSWTAGLDGTCLPNGPSFTGYAAITIASDIIVAILPLPVVWNLNVSKVKKIGLAGVFVLGLFTTLCSILRYIQINRIQYGDGDSTMLIVWGVIEFCVGNVVSSLPFLAPVFIRKAKQYRSKQSDGYDSGRIGYRFGSKPDHYKLESMNGDSNSKFNRMGRENSSEENMILKEVPEDSIMKSVTYSVKVDEEARPRSSRSARARSGNGIAG